MRSEYSSCPEGHYDNHNSKMSSSILSNRNTPPARKGITTAEGAQAVINWLKSYGIYLVRREMLTSPMHATASKETAR